ncbi:MAG: dephospho-CoA kinase [Oscillospiraceae bacterium]|nr:dephospho-CoA kinase [Oscillospiraceae bacterium]MDD3261573.1 dephospho-CoA kinase [Oscillospiraceae bacterium]
MASFVIGLTGPTGAGKSTWTAAFRALGCAVIDCDALAKTVTESPAVQQKLQGEFGTDILQNGILNRRLLAARAFADAASVQRLNAITHPAIGAEIAREMRLYEKQNVRAVVIDAPLLFEGGLEKLCRVTAAVLAPRQVRLARIEKRDGITPKEAERRMASQHDDAFFRQHADCILDGALPQADIPARAQVQLGLWLGENV